MCVAFLFVASPSAVSAARAPCSIVLAVNRDEFFARSTRECHWWDDHPQIFAGRDAEAGGTWLGLTRDGRVAVLTNFTERDKIPDAPSRGELPVGYLTDPDRRTPAAYLADLAPRRDEYNGFNLLVGDCRTLEFAYLGNRGDVADAPPSTLVAPDHLDDGARGTVFGLSNATLDHPWPKVLRGKAALREEMRRAAARVDPVVLLERVLENRATRVENVETRASSLAELPSPFVRPGDAANEPGYGTRCSTVIVVDADGAGATVTERALDAEGRAWQPDATARIEFEGCVRRAHA